MIRKHLIASAVILLLGGCGSSKSDSTPDSGTPATSDSGPKTDTPVVVADGGVGDTGGTNPGTDALLGDTGAGLADVGVKLDSTVVADAPVDAASPDVNTPSPDTRPDTGSATPDLAVDTAKPTPPDAAPDTTPDTGKPVYDGGLGLSCIKGLFGTYVLRWDGILIDETTPTSPQTVFEASTGLPLNGVVAAQQGPSHGCAVLAAGTVQCWQNESVAGNNYGQLGNGTTTAVTTHYRATPVVTAPSTPLTNVVSMAPMPHNNAACAVTTDGKLWCWGDLSWLVNEGNTLSTGYAQAITTDGTTPLTGVIAAASGPGQACAITVGTPNSVWCWGSNGAGELGQGDTTNRQYPTRVLGLANPTQIALTPYIGYYSSTVCVVDGSGIKCWGQNIDGEAGVNTTTSAILSPTSVVVESGSALDGVTTLVAGYTTFAVLRPNGTIWIWGGVGRKRFAANYGQTNVLAVGWAGMDPAIRFLTSDGVYHNDTVPADVNCNAL